MDSKFRKQIKAWRDRIGYEQAAKSLVVLGVSISAAQKLLAGTYVSEPKPLLRRAIEAAMKESA